MGDKSPKATHKKAAQKQHHAEDVKRKKQAIQDAKHVVAAKGAKKK